MKKWQIALVLILGFNLGFYFNFKQSQKNIKTNTVDLVVANVPYDEMLPIYAEPNENSEKISEFCGQTCLTSNLYSDRRTINGFAKVELLDGREGYVSLGESYYITLHLENIEDENRRIVCETALKYLGTPYKDIQCTGLIRRSFLPIEINYGDKYVTEYDSDEVGKKISEKELQPGDLVLYESIGGGISNGHIGLYLGDGFVIQSTLDKGAKYPTGGIRITKLTFRDSPTSLRDPFVKE